MFDNGYQCRIEYPIIYFNKFYMEGYEFKINLKDLVPNFNLPENLVRYLTGYYEFCFAEQIEREELINRREERIKNILKK